MELKGPLKLGIEYVGFMHKSDRTFLNIKGKLTINGNYSIGRGCRFEVGDNATVTIGEKGFINANTTFVIMHDLEIGDGCTISWDCQFLDEDFHEITYAEKKCKDKSIKIGNHVWIGCGVKIYGGSTIPDNCVVASDSIVKGCFLTPNSLIAGHPARIIREHIVWK
jgi:acetyltransferase-like isoleucine patch superfamily enzyme